MSTSTITLTRGVVSVAGDPFLKFASNSEAAAFLILRCNYRYLVGSMRDGVAQFAK